MSGLGKVIAWARGDPESIKVVRAAKEVLEEQGFQIVLPEVGSRISCDVLVEPWESSELEGLSARIEAKGRVRERDPWRALFKALFYPSGPSSLRIGIDPGTSCALAAYADSVLVWTEKLQCSEVSKKISWLLRITGAQSHRINVGAGEGYEVVVEELMRAGLSFALVSEEGTTRRGRPFRGVRDKDISAAASLALKVK
ncbi:MAG: hypothetical protein NZ902_05790 [Acidilobaceae archaeon]|nr:hypothetical protein [Acidilobaceae archaeon]MCX8166076.1 hypothetical protein [Acidilobaceae archaeon]MDW7974719.1 hypothetical protein [Sulfolobales archaeon]